MSARSCVVSGAPVAEFGCESQSGIGSAEGDPAVVHVRARRDGEERGVPRRIARGVAGLCVDSRRGEVVGAPGHRVGGRFGRAGAPVSGRAVALGAVRAPCSVERGAARPVTRRGRVDSDRCRDVAAIGEPPETVAETCTVAFCAVPGSRTKRTFARSAARSGRPGSSIHAAVGCRARRRERARARAVRRERGHVTAATSTMTVRGRREILRRSIRGDEDDLERERVAGDGVERRAGRVTISKLRLRWRAGLGELLHAQATAASAAATVESRASRRIIAPRCNRRGGRPKVDCPCREGAPADSPRRRSCLRSR